LLVIDEEHRFGVQAQGKAPPAEGGCRYPCDDCNSDSADHADVIDRRVRDMSLIATSPKDRLPIYHGNCRV